MVSGWATPVQVGNNVLAVLEFYCHLRLREDRETTAAMETVAASLGQMLARTRERERAEELSRQQKILLHSVADGICGVDRNGLVRFANPAATRLLGAPVGKSDRQARARPGAWLGAREQEVRRGLPAAARS